MATYDLDIYVNGTKYSDNLISYKLVERLNQVPYIEANFVDILTANTDVVYGKWIAIKSDNSGNWVSPKLMLSEVGDLSDDFVDVKAEGWVERKLKDFLVTNTASADVNSQAGRPQYNSESVSDIVTEQLAAYTTSVSAGTLSSEVINIRSEGDNLISFIAGCASVASTDWYSSYSSDLATSSINVTSKGSDKSATIILNASGVSQNCEAGERKQNYDLLKNVLVVRGYGDGINQLESKCFHATSSRTKLSAELSATAVTASVVDASVLPATGSVWIGCEKVSYSGKSSNDLTGLTRGVAFQGNVSKAYAHAVNSPVYDAQYTEASPQSTGNGSSINTHGLKMESFELREIIDQSTLDILAEKLLTERKGTTTSYLAPESILVYPEDYVWGKENIVVGDEITINDAEAGLSGKYRVYGSTLSYDSGVYSLELEVSNVTQSVLSEIKDDANKGVTLSKYMQGATNIFSVNETDNVESGDTDYQGLTLFFNIPEDAVAINSVKLSYRNEAPKTWSSVTAGESSHTHTIPSLTVNATSTSSTTSDSTDITSNQGTDSITTTKFNEGTAYDNFLSESFSGNYNLIHVCIYLNLTLYTGSYFDGGTVTVTAHIGTNTSDQKKVIRRIYPVSQYTVSLKILDTLTFYNDGKDTSSTMYLDFAHDIDSDGINVSGNMYVYGELKTHTHTIQSVSVNGTTTVSTATSAGSSHSHTVAYDLSQQSYGTTDIKVWTCDDASGTPTWTERTSAIEAALPGGPRQLYFGNNQSEVDLPLTSYFSSPGWKGIRLTTNGNSRIKAQATIKCYVNSRVD